VEAQNFTKSFIAHKTYYTSVVITTIKMITALNRNNVTTIKRISASKDSLVVCQVIDPFVQNNTKLLQQHMPVQ